MGKLKTYPTLADGGFAALTPAHIERLAEIVGEGQVIAAGHERFERYGHDETEDFYFAPGVGVRVETAAQIAEILALANAESLPVTPWAAGTSLSGAALPVYGGIVLSVERMNKILDIDEANGFAVVEPGVITQNLQDAVRERGLYYPPDPASRGSCTIGGNIAMNSGGPHCVKYGVTKDYVTGLNAILATGAAVKFGGKLLKDVAGYNMVQTFVGSEGTLGVITEATLKLVPYPPHRRLILASFDAVEDCAACVAKIFHTRITPAACEFLERAAIEAASKHMGKVWPLADQCAAQLLIELDGFDDDRLDAEVEIVGQTCLDAGASDVLLADTDAKQAELWAMRRATGEAVKKLSTYKEEDTCVPRMQLPALVHGVHDICDRHGIRMICYGHAGDGNLHCNLLKDGLSDEFWGRDVLDAVREIFKLVVSLGGTITGEHGIGFVQREFLPIAQTATEIAAQWAIKRALDPRGILNPGKLFPAAVAELAASTDFHP